MQLRDFPFDLQTLTVKIRFPYAHDRTSIATLPMDADTGASVVLDPSLMLIDFDVRQPSISLQVSKMKRCELFLFNNTKLTNLLRYNPITLPSLSPRQYPMTMKNGKKHDPKPQFLIKIPVQR